MNRNGRYNYPIVSKRSNLISFSIQFYIYYLTIPNIGFKMDELYTTADHTGSSKHTKIV